MPLLLEQIQQGGVSRLPQIAPEQPAERPPALDVLAAASRQANIAGSLYDAVANGTPTTPEVADGYDALDDIAGYEDFAERFITADNPSQTRAIKARIDQEQRDRKTLGEAGGWGLAATLGAGLTDPTTLLSMAVPLGGETRLAKIGTLIGQQIAFDSASELAFHGLQETRTAEESAINVGAGAVLAGTLGALITRVPKGKIEALRQKLATDLQTPVESTGGAAAVRATTREQETISTGGEALAETLGRVSPGDRLLTSESLAARRLVQELSETPEMMAKNLEGIATPTSVETLLKRRMGSWWEAYRDRGLAFGEYRKRVKAEGGKPLSRGEFSQEVAYAMRRGDQSPIPEVADAARQTRKLVFEPDKAKAIKLGLLPEDVKAKGADSYLMRQYDVGRIRANQGAWIETLADGFQAQGVTRAEAIDIAHKVTRNILGSERGTLDLDVMGDVVPESGRLKERTLNLPDEVLEPWLVNDIDHLTEAYLRTLGPEVEITERFGDRQMKDAISQVTDEYGVLKQRAVEAKDDATLARLQKLEERDMQDIAALRDRLYGRFGSPKDPGSFFVRAGRLIRSVNYVRLLGGQVISAFTDAARLVMQYGAPKLASSALRLATNIEALKIGRTAARKMGIGLDLVLNTRGIALGDVAAHSAFAEQRVMRKIADVFSVASLQSPWNAVMKSWASVMSQDDVLRAASKIADGKALSKRDVARFASMGLDEDMLRRVAQQTAEHGTESNGLRFANSDQWKDQSAAQAYEAAILREVDMAILTPGAGDLPLVYSTEWGKALLQFKSFAISSTRRLVIPTAQGLAQGDIKTMQGVAALYGVGALVYVLKQTAAEQPIATDPTRFAMEVVDKSGMLAWGGDVIFPSLWQMGSDDFSRWSDRQPVETLLGPVGGTVADLYTSRWPSRVTSGELSQADIHKLRRLMPGQNLFYLRRAINELEAQAGEAVGATP